MNLKFRIVLLVMLNVVMLPVSSIRTQARLHTAASSMRAALRSPAVPTPIFGELVIGWNKTVKLNGVEVPSGTTIASGAQIETPEGVPAAVIFKYRARIQIAPNTNLTLNLSETSVEVNLLDGCVTLTPYEGITGVINIPQGKTLTVGPDEPGYIDVCNSKRGGNVPIVDYTICTGCPSREFPIPTISGGSGSPLLFALGLGGGGSAAAAAVFAAANSGRTEPLSSFIPSR